MEWEQMPPFPSPMSEKLWNTKSLPLLTGFLCLTEDTCTFSVPNLPPSFWLGQIVGM